MGVGIFVILFLGGLGAGFVNAAAGGGSALTLPILMMAGLDATVANGTNRIAVGIQAATATTTFHRNGVRPWRSAAAPGFWVLLGAIVGAIAAVRISTVALEWVFGLLFFVLAFLIARKREWLTPSEIAETASARVRIPVLFSVGLYGGFLQAGVGIPLLLVLVNLVGFEAVRGNAAKSAVILVYSCVILVIFNQAQQVDWLFGAVLGIGGIIGSVLGTRLVIQRGAGFIRMIVVCALLLAGIRSLWINLG